MYSRIMYTAGLILTFIYQLYTVPDPYLDVQCSAWLEDKGPELKQQLGLEILIRRNRLQWCGHVQRKADDLMKSMHLPRGQPKRTEVIENVEFAEGS